MRFRIAGQLAAGFAVPTVALAIVAFVAYGGIRGVANANAHITAAAAIETASHDLVYRRILTRFAIRNVVLKGKAADYAAHEAAQAKLKDDIAFLGAHVDRDREMGRVLGELQTISETIDGRNEEQLSFARRRPEITLAAFRGTQAAGSTEAAAIAASLAANARDIPVEAALSDRLAALAAADVASAQASFASAYQRAIVVGSLAALAALLATVIIATLLGARIARRLQRLRRALGDVVANDVASLTGAFRALGAGDLTASFASAPPAIVDRGTDEIAELTTSYNALAASLETVGAEYGATTERLRRIIRGLQASSSELSVASAQVTTSTADADVAIRQIAHGIDGVASGSRDQSGRLSEASVAVEELLRAAEQIADGASAQSAAVQSSAGAVGELDEQIASLAVLGDALAGAARRSTAEVDRVGEAVRSTAAVMALLREQAGSTAEAMRALESRSDAVQAIVETIDGIADQTNLLALNAAIEAARAGEHGRGFAVVADEVRKLAESATTSTKEIGRMLGAIRGETERVASAMRSSTASMDDGMARAQHAASTLQNVAEAIGTTTQAAEEMAVRADEMRAASSQVAQGLANVSAVVEENAAATGQMRATTQSATAAILPVAASAEEQSATAEHVSSSTVELAAQMQQMAATAEQVRAQAAQLSEVAGAFVVERRAPGAQPALVA